MLLVQDKGNWLAVVNAVMNLGIFTQFYTAVIT
jgi:hypothetical protein